MKKTITIKDIQKRAANRKRSKTMKEKNKSKIDLSKNREDYIQLIKQGWSARQLEQYAQDKHNEKITAQTFAKYRREKINPNDYESMAHYRAIIDTFDIDRINQVKELTEIMTYLKARIGSYAKLDPAFTYKSNETHYIKLYLEALSIYTEIVGKMPPEKPTLSLNDLSTLINALPKDERKEFYPFLVDLNHKIRERFKLSTD